MAGVYLPVKTAEDSEYAEDLESQAAPTQTSRWKISLLVAGSLTILVMLSVFMEREQNSAQGNLSTDILPDDLGFFTQNNVAPASWSETPGSVSCIHDYVDRKGLRGTKFPLKDWGINFAKESGCPVYPIPQGGFLFHTHWNGPWTPAWEFSIDSFLATQKLDAGHKLVFWHGAEWPPPQEVVDRYTHIAPHSVEFRIMDYEAESKGTCLEHKREWVDAEYRKEINMGPAFRSDLMRAMLLAKYGGLWIDSDSAFTRDITPLLRGGPMAPAHYPAANRSVDPEHFYNNHFIFVGPPSSGVGQRYLETMCSLDFRMSKWDWNKYPFRPSHDRVTDDGALQVCERYNICGLAIYPLAFVEAETWTPEPLLKPCRPTTERYANSVLSTTWLWHHRQDNEQFCSKSNTGVRFAVEKVAEGLERNLRTRSGQTLMGLS